MTRTTWAALLAAGLLTASQTQAAGIFKDLDNWIDRHGHCFWCHDSRKDMEDWLKKNREFEAKNHTLAPLIHANHRHMSKDLTDCTNCHGNGPEAHWKTDVEIVTCSGCHDLKSVLNHDKYTNADCKGCHTPKSVEVAHIGEQKRIEAQHRRDLVRVEITDARIVRDEKGAARTKITFRVTGKDGNALFTKGNPAEAEWLRNLVFYTNWGVTKGFLSGRGTPIYVKSDFRDIRNRGDETTPEGERARTKATCDADGLCTVTGEAFELPQDRKTDAGLVTSSLTFCHGEDLSLLACEAPGAMLNGAWATHRYFNDTGLIDWSHSLRAKVTDNKKCGFCHDYDKGSDNAKLKCGGYHSEKTKTAETLAGKKHFAGHDKGTPRAVRSGDIASPTVFSTADTDVTGCVACHNAEAVPTSAIREKRVSKGDAHFIDELLVSHPAWNVFVHSIHDNARPGAEGKDNVRHMSYAASTASCGKCHYQGTWDPARLAREGKPLAIDSKYNAEDRSYPAKAGTPDLWASPVSATCYACHAKKTNEKGEVVWNDKAKKHIVEMGGSLGVEKNALKPENCAACHSGEALAKSHKLKERGYESPLGMHPAFKDRMPIPEGAPN